LTLAFANLVILFSNEITIEKYILILQVKIMQLSSDLHKKRLDVVSS